MSQAVYIAIALVFYVLAGALILLALRRGQPLSGPNRQMLIYACAGGLLFHAGGLFFSLHSEVGLNLALTSAASLVAWTIVLLFTLALLRQRIENLGLAILPITILALIAQGAWPGLHALPAQNSMAQSVHITISLLSYSLLSLAAAQSLVVLIQEHQLKHKHPGGFIRAMPPAQTMEQLMVQLVLIGFILLTLTMASGLFFSQEIFGQPFRLSHHIVLSMAAWLVFGIFLLGHWKFGWRGNTAVRWVLIGSILLMLGYLGTKFVLEVLLQRQ